MFKSILFAGLTAAAISASPSSQAQVPANQQVRNHALVRVVTNDNNDNYGHWLKCADAAGMCGVAAG